MLPNAKELRAETERKLADEAEKARLAKEAYDATLPTRKKAQITYNVENIEKRIVEAHKEKKTSVVVSVDRPYEGTAEAITKLLKKKGFRVESKRDTDEYYSYDGDGNSRGTGEFYPIVLFNISW